MSQPLTNTEVSTARLLTPPGPGAVAVVQVQLTPLQNAQEVLHAFEPTPSRELQVAPLSRILYGRWNGEDVVVVRTELQTWEIHCHGGTVAVAQIRQDLETAGVCFKANFESVTPQHDPAELADDAFTTELIQRTLLKCRTRKTASLVLAQDDGRLNRLASELRSEISETHESARRHVQRWLNVATHLIKPFRVAIIGEPNVGKSSLLNAIAGLQRSIVSSTPGTTRDLVEVDVIIDGWSFQFVDTAGVREHHESDAEKQGIDRTLMTLSDCEILCFITDATLTAADSLLQDHLQLVTVPNCCVHNKCDLLPEPQEPVGLESHGAKSLYVSAKTGAGIPELLRWIVRAAVPEEPSLETTLPLQFCDH